MLEAPWYWILVPLAFAGWWYLLVTLIARLGGWRTLARSYPDSGPAAGNRFRFQSAQLGWCNYGGCVHVDAGVNVLRFSLMAPFSFGHPPIAIPWHDIGVEFKRQWLSETAVLRFSREPTIRMRITRRLAERIAASSQGQFALPHEPT